MLLQLNGFDKNSSQKLSLLLEEAIRKEHPYMKDSYKKLIKKLINEI